MQFVRREAGATTCTRSTGTTPSAGSRRGEGADRGADPAPSTQQALRQRGADYLEQTRTPQESWKTLDDLAPQLAEFELRGQGQDYDTAAQVLLGIGFDYLIRWGHYRLAVELRRSCRATSRPGHRRGQQGQSRQLPPDARGVPPGHRSLRTGAIHHRKAGDWANQSVNMSNLGNCYYELGQIRRAIESYEQALAIDRETGYRQGQAVNLGNLGNCYSDLGQIGRAIESTSRRWPSTARPATRRARPTAWSSLGDCYVDLGQIPPAIGLHGQALAVARQIGHRSERHGWSLGGGVWDLGAWDRAAQDSGRTIDVANAIGTGRHRARLVAACRRPACSWRPPATQQVADAARGTTTRDRPSCRCCWASCSETGPASGRSGGVRRRDHPGR